MLPKSRVVKRQFSKMHGLGNDFVILDGRTDAIEMSPELAKSLADRHVGIGCDQLILLEPSTVADMRMRIWNHDGGEVESCGNASRCVVALTGAKTIETGGGIVEGTADGDEVEVSLPPPSFAWDDIPLAYPMGTAALPMAWGPLEHPMALSVGNPHLVFFVANPAAIAIDDIGPSIEHDPVFPDRINVNIAHIDHGGITLRTWERGAGLTLACGTGASGPAVAPLAANRGTSPGKVSLPGGWLTIAWEPDGPITMRGAATLVFTGAIDLDDFAA
jgi:diaminopimelate epimerase